MHQNKAIACWTTSRYVDNNYAFITYIYIHIMHESPAAIWRGTSILDQKGNENVFKIEKLSSKFKLKALCISYLRSIRMWRHHIRLWNASNDENVVAILFIWFYTLLTSVLIQHVSSWTQCILYNYSFSLSSVSWSLINVVVVASVFLYATKCNPIHILFVQHNTAETLAQYKGIVTL